MKKLALSFCLFALMIALVACSQAGKIVTTDGDKVEENALIGSWKLVSVDANGFHTTSEKRLDEMNYAIHWVTFEKDQATLSYDTQKGELDTTSPYQIRDNQIVFTEEAVGNLTAKLSGGQLVVLDDKREIGGKKSVFTLGKA